MNKRAIAILGAIFILIVGTLGFLIFAKYSGGSKPSQPPGSVPPVQNATTTAQIPTQPATTTPPASAGPFYKLTSDQVVSPAMFFNGAGITYFDNQGNLYQSDLQNTGGQLSLTNKKQLDIPAKTGITKILWPAKGNDFIAVMQGLGGTSYSYFNSNTALYTDLPPQVESLDWMPNGTQIAYVWLQNGKASLSLGNPDTSHHITLGNMWELDDELHVSPDGLQILYYETGNNSSATNFINSVSIDGKTWKGLVKNGYNYGVLWSPDGQKFLFGKKDPVSLSYQLWVDNLSTGEVKNLGLMTTPDKAVWDSGSQVIYAAVPNSGQATAGALTTDSFFRMDTGTMDKTQYASSSVPMDGQNLFLDSADSKLFFKNAQDGGLYYLDLAQSAGQ